jgi:hypothetical protein
MQYFQTSAARCMSLYGYAAGFENTTHSPLRKRDRKQFLGSKNNNF